MRNNHNPAKATSSRWRLLAVLMCLSLFAAACGSSDDSAAETDETTTTAAEADDATTSDDDEADDADESTDADDSTDTDESTDTEEPPAETVGYEPLDPRESVRYAGQNIAMDAPVLVAEERGYFDEVGIDFEFVTVGGGEAATLLGTNQIELGSIGVNVGFFNAAAQDAAFYVAAAPTLLNENSVQVALVLREDLVDSYTGPEDLADMKIGMTAPTGTVGYYLSLWLADGGLTFDDVELVTGLQYTDQLVALSNGNVDAIVASQPFVTQAEAGDIGQIIATDGEAAPGAALYVGMSDGLLQRPEVGERFFYAWARAQAEIYEAVEGSGEGLEELLDLLAVKTPTDRETWEVLYEGGGLTGIPKDGLFDPTFPDKLQAYFLSLELIEEEIDISPLLNTTFLEAALERLPAD